MSCPYTPEDLSAYVDGEYGGGDADRIREHLRGCAACSSAVEWLRGVAQLVGGLPRAEPRQTAVWQAERLAEPTPRQMQCTAALPEASAYVDGELSDEEATEVLNHLFTCDPCYRAHKQLEHVAEVLQATEPAPVPAGLEQRILAAVEAESHAVVRQWVSRTVAGMTPGLRWGLRLAAAAVFLLVVAAGVYQTVGVPFGSPAPRPVAVASAPLPSTSAAKPGEARPAPAGERAAPSILPFRLPQWRLPSLSGAVAALTGSKPVEAPRPAPPMAPAPTPAPRVPGVMPFAPAVRTPPVAPSVPTAPSPSLMIARGPDSGVTAPEALQPPTASPLLSGPKTTAPEEARVLPARAAPPAPRVAERPQEPEEGTGEVELRAPRATGWTPVYQPTAAIDRDRLEAAASRIGASVVDAKRAATPKFRIPIK